MEEQFVKGKKMRHLVEGAIRRAFIFSELFV